MKRSALAALALSFSARFALAGVGFDGAAFNLNDEPARLEYPMPAPAPEKAGPDKEWTIMVFINAKNNLERYGLKDMNEMEMIGSGDKYNVVVELGRIKGHDSSEEDWTTSRRYLVRKDDDPARVTSPVVEELPRTDMGDYRHLADFANWAKTRYPAKKYMLIVWNHGAGWIKSAGGLNKGISYDDETGNHIDTPQLGLALGEMGGVDVYGSDACLMQMAEVVYELKDSAAYIVGSEETEPGDGYTYNDFLAMLAARQDMAPAELARAAVDAYSDHYKKKGAASTQSYVRTSAVSGLLAAANAFTSALTLAGEKGLARKALGEAQSYDYPENKDLHHFAGLVAAGTKNAGVKRSAEALMANIKTGLVGHNRTNNASNGDDWWPLPASANYDNSHGLAVYLPGSGAPEHYAELAWARDSGWDEFLGWLAQP